MPWRPRFPKFGAGPGLARVRGIASVLGLELPDFGIRGAVVVGTNGKGSTAAMTASMLQQTATGVGLFTSPHLFDLSERFRIDDDDISEAELARHWDRVERAAAAHLGTRIMELGAFEFLFLIAADWFAARGCSHTVWEAGIGGRFDPVRLVEARRVALTSLDYEHTDLLGGTLEEIARQKIDAAPEGATLFVGRSCAPQRQAIDAHCATRKIKPAHMTTAVAGAALPGEHQGDNAALAIALARDLAGPALTEARISAGLAAARWPGRLETISSDPLMVIDVGHTPAGIAAALAGFRAIQQGRKGILVCGASQDKDVEAIISPLASAFPVIICAAARHKGASASDIARIAIKANPEAEVVIAGDVAEAQALAMAKAGTKDAAIYAAGGLFLAAEFKAVHLGRDPATLAFF